MAREKSRGAQHFGIVGGEFVSRQHLDDHFVVRFIGVERVDDPLAPAPNMRLAFADFGAIAVPIAIAPHVHPMPSPTFGVLRRSKQLIDHGQIGLLALRRVRRAVCLYERFHICGRRRQADEVEIEPTNERPRVGFRQRRHAPFLLFNGQQRIDRMQGRRGILGGRVLRRRHLRPHERLERPVFARIGGQRLVGAGSAGGDPAFEQGDFRRSQRLAFQRHLLDIAVAANSRQQQTLLGVLRHDGRTRIAAGQHNAARIQAQTAALLEGSVAGVALTREQRLHIARVVRRGVRRFRRFFRSCRLASARRAEDDGDESERSAA